MLILQLGTVIDKMRVLWIRVVNQSSWNIAVEFTLMFTSFVMIVCMCEYGDCMSA
jgi:hypothetical protein